MQHFCKLLTRKYNITVLIIIQAHVVRTGNYHDYVKYNNSFQPITIYIINQRSIGSTVVQNNCIISK